jgi:hypothetical protein
MLRRKTVDYRQDPKFIAIGEHIDARLTKAGYLHRYQIGSVSWLGRISPGSGTTTLFKLCNYGDGQIAFGVRSEFVDAHEQLRALRWPIDFSVPPDTSAEFHGMLVLNEESSLARIERILNALGPQDRNVRDAHYEERQMAFDGALDQLGL